MRRAFLIPILSWLFLRPLLAWAPLTFVEKVTKFTAAVGNNIETGISEAKAIAAAAKTLAERATSQGGTAGVTGYIGPLVSVAVSKQGVEEAGFLEALESYADGCTPEVELKMETTYAGTTNPGVANISSFLSLYKAIGPKKRHRGHTLIWWSGLAKWAETFSGTEAAFKEQIFTYIRQVVEAVGQRVDSWDVLNELTNAGALRSCLYTTQLGGSLTIVKTNPVMKFYAECIRVAREANPDAAMFVNEYEIETTFNYSSGTQRGEVFLSFINVLIELAAENPALYGAPDGIGMQFHTNTSRLVTAAEIQAIVPKYTAKELVVEITEFDCQIEPGETETKQEEVYAAMIEGAKKAGIGRVTIWGVTDKRSWLKTSWENPQKMVATTLGTTKLRLKEPIKLKFQKVASGKQVQVQFRKLDAGITGLVANTTYFIVGAEEGGTAATEWIELSATEGGGPITLAGANMTAAGSEISKWGGESSAYPRPCPFNWNGEVKSAWRAVERSRPEQPGIGPWKLASAMTPNLVQAVTAQPGRARTEGLNVRFDGVVEATAKVSAGTTILTLPAGLRPSAAKEIPCQINKKPGLLGVGTNGAVEIKEEEMPAAGSKLRLDGLTFAL